MRIDTEIKLGFKDVLIRPKRSTLKSRADVSLERTYKFKHSKHIWTGIPIIASNMDTIGTFNMASALKKHGLITALHKHYTLQQYINFFESQESRELDHISISLGILEEDFNLLSEIISIMPGIKFICVDVANGYNENFVDFVARVRDKFPEHILIAGNVVTGEMVEQLVLSGADIVKVGIGPGSVCTTRLKTGVGYPQISAIIECADAAHGLKGLIIADGGCACPGDVAKAFGAGADYVMLGGMLAGHEECDGEKIERNGQLYIEFYGMSSATAMEKHKGGVADYRAAEGKSVELPYRGPVEHTIRDILGGVRSACTYVGAESLKELSKRTTFIQVQEQENQVFT